jgi:hypothetical protein
MVTTPPVPVAEPVAKLTLAVVIAHVGASAAPLGDEVKVHDVRLTVFGPKYPPVPVAVIAEVPLEPAVIVTGAALRVKEPTSAPVPVRPTVCGEPDALSARLIEAVSDPAAAGVKVTVIVQEAEPAMVLAAQLSVSVKELALVPVIPTVAIARASTPVLVRVTVFVAAELPTAVEVKVSDVGERLTAGATAVTKALAAFATFSEPRPVAASKPTVES